MKNTFKISLLIFNIVFLFPIFSRPALADCRSQQISDCLIFVNDNPRYTSCISSCQNGSSGNGSLDGIVNPSISRTLGRNDAGEASNGTTFSTYFILIWRGLIVVGTLAMLFNLVNGALEWITAGGESEKVKHARMKMTEGVVGLIILMGTFAAITFLSQVFHLNVLKFDIPSPGP